MKPIYLVHHSYDNEHQFDLFQSKAAADKFAKAIAQEYFDGREQEVEGLSMLEAVEALTGGTCWIEVRKLSVK